MRKRIIVWQANRRLKKMFKRSFSKGILEMMEKDKQEQEDRIADIIADLENGIASRMYRVTDKDTEAYS
jgi:hypothetical protein